MIKKEDNQIQIILIIRDSVLTNILDNGLSFLLKNDLCKSLIKKIESLLDTIITVRNLKDL